MAKETNIEVSLPDYVRQIAIEAGRAAAHEVLAEHRANCQIAQLAVEVWGQAPDTPGLKAHVAELRAARAGFGWVLRYILTPVIVAILTSMAILLVFGRSPIHASANPPSPTTQGVPR